MKILPVKYNINIIKNINNKYPLQTSEKNDIEISRMPNVYYSPVGFQGVDNQALLTKELKSLENMHCPLCGTKMLSRDEMNVALQEADELKNGEGFVKFIDKYGENINPHFSKMIKNLRQKSLVNKNKPLTELFNSFKEAEQHRSDFAFNNVLEKLNNLADSDEFSDADKEILRKCSYKMNVIPKNSKREGIYKHFNNQLKTSIGLLEYKDKKTLFNDLNENVRNNFVNEYLYVNKYHENEQLHKSFIRNLLFYSKSDLRKVFDSQSAKDKNLMLSCEHCEITNKSLKRSKVKPYIYYNHIYELSQQALDGKISQNPSYPINLLENIRRCTYSHLTPDKTNPSLCELMKVVGAKDKRFVEFEVADQQGVSCASCGQKTITHEEKKEMFEKVKNAESVQELAAILNDNEEIIKPKFAKLVSTFNSVLKKSPNVTEKTMFKILRNYTNDELQNSMFNCISELRKISGKFKINAHDRKLVNDFVSKVGKMISYDTSKQFPYDEYRLNVVELSKGLETPFMSEFWDVTMASMFVNIQLQHLFYPNNDTVEKVGTPLKVAIQDILKDSVATVDHLDPKYKYNPKENQDLYTQGRENRKANLVVMCKDCNGRKNTQDLKKWVRKNPEMKHNLVKYLKEVKQLRKDNKIGAEFNYYSQDVLYNFKKLTNISLDMDGD